MSTKLERLNRENAAIEAEIEDMNVAISAVRSKIYMREGAERRGSAWRYADFIEAVTEAEEELTKSGDQAPKDPEKPNGE